MEMYIATFLFLVVMIYLGMLKLVLGEDRREISMADKAALVPQRPPAPATFLGYQKFDGPELQQVFELWTLAEGISGHPQGSTVSRQTLEKAGYIAPPQVGQPTTLCEQTSTPGGCYPFPRFSLTNSLLPAVSFSFCIACLLDPEVPAFS